MTFPPNLGPIAPERNPTPVPQYFSPSLYYITAITNGQTTTITTAANHNYVIGQLVRTIVPITYGEIQMNEVSGYVLSIPSANQVVLAIDSSKFDTFISSPTYGPTKPQISGIGDINSGESSNSNARLLNATTIPGAFINTSPIKGTWLN